MLRGRGVRSGKPGGAAPRGGVSGPASVGRYRVGFGLVGRPPVSGRPGVVSRSNGPPTPGNHAGPSAAVPDSSGAAGPRAGSARSPAARRRGETEVRREAARRAAGRAPDARRGVGERRGHPRPAPEGPAGAGGGNAPSRRRPNLRPGSGTPAGKRPARSGAAPGALALMLPTALRRRQDEAAPGCGVVFLRGERGGPG